jgi:hypothetical protein
MIATFPVAEEGVTVTPAEKLALLEEPPERPETVVTVGVRTAEVH